ncbi:hypothetical protein KYJ26_00300 [Bacillus sp. MCCB 382]|uniref:hypothetical protein n=1 Tax=Bacillus sp. MCCB 382 TaxID=2860197 RepID=UPI001C58D5CD|nr:hypothetical protein [Bacillus sp. MCCB 382]
MTQYTYRINRKVYNELRRTLRVHGAGRDVFISLEQLIKIIGAKNKEIPEVSKMEGYSKLIQDHVNLILDIGVRPPLTVDTVIGSAQYLDDAFLAG